MCNVEVFICVAASGDRQRRSKKLVMDDANGISAIMAGERPVSVHCSVTEYHPGLERVPRVFLCV